MENYKSITCPQLAFNWSIKLIESFLIPILLSFLLDELFLKVAFITFGVLDYIISSLLTTYGFSVIKAFIWFKVDQDGISNFFCKIRWDEIQLENIYFEHIRIKRTLTNNHKLKFVSGDCGVVMMVQKKNTANTNFKKYSLKNAICIPLNAQTRTALVKNCSNNFTIKNALVEFQEEYILEMLSKHKLKVNKKKYNCVIPATEVYKDRTS